MKGLYARLAVAFIGITSGVLLISTLTFMLETHYHFSMYQHQAKNRNMDTAAFDAHFEQALLQSVSWAFVIGILIAAVVSLYVAKRITTPLIEMKAAAEQMAKGSLKVRTRIKGKDELADLGQSLNDLADQLIKQEQLRKTMTADAAHELRTPLATLKSHMTAMLDGIWEPTPKRLESCYEEIERLALLVDDLGKLTELESPYFQLELQRGDLAAAARQSVEAARAAFDEKGVQLEFLASEPVFAIFDRKRVSQIFANLLANALKFTPPAGVVSVSLAAEKQMAAVIVRDTGTGIKESELPFVFERFYRGEKSRSRETGGAGIGLAIVKAIIEAHGGDIRMISEEGKGTEVQVLFKDPL